MTSDNGISASFKAMADEKTTDVYLRDREVPLVDGPVMIRKSAA